MKPIEMGTWAQLTVPLALHHVLRDPAGVVIAVLAGKPDSLVWTWHTVRDGIFHEGTFVASNVTDAREHLELALERAGVVKPRSYA